MHLDLSSNEFKKEGADFLFQELAKNQTLNCLYIGNAKGLHRNFLNGDGISGLNSFVENHLQLTILDLQGASIGNEGFALIYNGLIQAKSLKVLNLGLNLITATSNKILCEMMGKSAIKRLDLSQNNIHDQFKFELEASTKNRIFLQSHLNLSKCNFIGPGMFTLFDALKKDTSLINLILDEAKFLSDEYQSLRIFLSGNTSLKSLSLKACNLGNKGAEAIAEGIAENTFIHELIISDNRIFVFMNLSITKNRMREQEN